MCVCDIADSLSMTQSAISHQLRILKQMDLVKNRRDGKTIFYSLADDHIVGILDMGLVTFWVIEGFIGLSNRKWISKKAL